jgi:hypothetical protein
MRTPVHQTSVRAERAIGGVDDSVILRQTAARQNCRSAAIADIPLSCLASFLAALVVHEWRRLSHERVFSGLDWDSAYIRPQLLGVSMTQ